MRAVHRQGIPSVVLAFALAVAACDTPPAAPPPEGSVSRSAVRSPAETAALLNRYHRARDYARIAPLIAAERRPATMAFLRRVDAVLDTHARLRRTALRRYGKPAAVAWDLSAMENNLGLFSARCRIIRQTFRGRTARVTIQEGDHVPMVHARFVRTARGWQYDPEAPAEELLGELEALAGILADVFDSIEAGADFRTYVDSLVTRILPQVRRAAGVGRRPAAGQAGRGRAGGLTRAEPDGAARRGQAPPDPARPRAAASSIAHLQ